MGSRVVVVSTGGTIAMRYDAEKRGDVPAVSGEELVAAVPALKDVAQLEVIEFANIPSFHMTPSLMFDLAGKVEPVLACRDVTGIVITHGTDTLEETAYLLDLYLPPGKPVCVTGAMHTSSHNAPDGPYNLLCAAKVASSENAAGHGVMVVMNGEIHAARYVTKMHTSSVATFASPYWAPLGHVDNDAVVMCAPLPKQAPLRPTKLSACVPTLKLYTGMDNALLEAIASMDIDGLVIEGYGRGNIPASAIPYIARIRNRGIPVVVATRVPTGKTLGVYAVEGGGAHLQSLGVIPSGALSSQKARLKLMLALGVSRDPEAIAACFTETEEIKGQ